jgi:cytochrome c551/c552
MDARTLSAPMLALAALLALPDAAAQARPAASQDAAMRRIAGERGCTVCHRDAAARDGATPLAPDWHQIATRYRGEKGAEQRLARIVVQGADPRQRHWKDRLEFTQMGSNAARVSPAEARALARWILSTP